jgi:RimK family alpha-L-glutamate ligase
MTAVAPAVPLPQAVAATALARRRLRAGRLQIVGRETLTNVRLAAAFEEHGLRTTIRTPSRRLVFAPGSTVLNRLDVVETLDGVDPGLWQLVAAERAGQRLLNRPHAVLNAHDKLATAIVLARHGVDHPRTAHVASLAVPDTLAPPFVVKPRFGSWGRDVFRCETAEELRACLEELAGRRWFRKQGALVQELVPSGGRDLRIVVAGGTVIGSIERVAAPGEWRTNVALGGVRRPVAEPPASACRIALRAAAALGTDLAGVDLVARANGRWTVLELNGAVDFNEEYGPDPFAAAAAALAPAAARTELATG